RQPDATACSRGSKHGAGKPKATLLMLLMLLSDLVEAAEQSARETSTRHGRGGERRAGQITAEVELMQSLIASWRRSRWKYSMSSLAARHRACGLRVATHAGGNGDR